MKVRVPSLAKLNLDLRVLSKRPDGFHELRTIFQTIDLQDTVQVGFDSQKRSNISLDCSIDIPDNLVIRAAEAVLTFLKVKGHVHIHLRKRIPMGAGLGGGSSNAGAVLIALPALIGKAIPIAKLIAIAEALGSDVPFFLYGGTALGLGRGAELYPLPDLDPHPALVIATGAHISTSDAYRALRRSGSGALTSQTESPILKEFQTLAWQLSGTPLEQLPLKNDFEGAVFDSHPELARVVQKLRRLGARPAMMTGSGSAIFGVFKSRQAAESASLRFLRVNAHAVRFVSRSNYLRKWRRALGPAFYASCLASGIG